MLRVCDRLVELYLKGGLPVASSGEAAGLLDAYWLGRPERLPEDERRALYARALGPGFEHGQTPRADFDAEATEVVEVAEVASDADADSAELPAG